MSLLSASDDPGGWTRAQWGMTDQEILDAFPGQATRLDPPEKYLEQQKFGYNVPLAAESEQF